MPDLIEPAPIELNHVGIVEFSSRGSQTDQDERRDDAKADCNKCWLVRDDIIKPDPGGELRQRPGGARACRPDGITGPKNKQGPAKPGPDQARRSKCHPG